MTHLDIINKAILYVGGQPKEVATGTDEITTASLAFYADAWKHVLSTHPWTAFTVREDMEGEEDSDLYLYTYELPSDCLMVSEILLVNLNKADDVSRAGRVLYTQWDELILMYTSSDGILPVSDYTDDIDIDIPVYVSDCVALKLASMIAFKVTQNVKLQSQLHSMFLMSLQEARIMDGYGRYGERVWGGRIDNGYDGLY